VSKHVHRGPRTRHHRADRTVGHTALVHNKILPIAAAVLALVIGLVVVHRQGASAAAAPVVSIYANNAVPVLTAEQDPHAVELGVTFKVAADGNVVGLRYYKSAQNTGAHTGTLWSSSGKALASATFTGESASGWQTLRFSSAVALKAGVDYVASYHTNAGYYAQQENAFASGATIGNPTIRALSGTYLYGRAGFPRNIWHNAAYYVDVLFQPIGKLRSSLGGTTSSSSVQSSSPAPVSSSTKTSASASHSVSQSQTSSSAAAPSTSHTQSTSVSSSSAAAPTKSASSAAPPVVGGGSPISGSGTSSTVPTSFPNSSNTGVPAGTTLTNYTGTCTLGAGAVIDAKTINCNLVIKGAGVTITRSQINGTVTSDHSASGSSTSSVSVTDSYINGGNQETFPTFGYDSVTLLRDEVVGGPYSVQCNSNCSVTDSYLHGQYISPGSAAHINAFLTNGGSGFVLKHNTVWCSVSQTSGDGGCSGDASLFGDFAPIKNATFTDNYFHSTHGSYCVYAGWEPSKSYPIPSNVVITNNVFQRGTDLGQHGYTCGYFGPDTSFYSGNSNVWSGNVYDDGTAVSS
jgi:Domain of unknown function (DUF4082)